MDVYLSTRRDLLVVKKGCPIPPVAAPGSWRKSKKRVVKVSEEIRSAIQAHGYYMRKLRDVHHTCGGMSMAAASTNVQSLQHHDKPRSHPRALPRDEPLCRQPAAHAGRVSRLSGAGRSQCGHRTRVGPDALGHAATASHQAARQ